MRLASFVNLRLRAEEGVDSLIRVDQLTPNLLDQSIGQLVLPTERDLCAGSVRNNKP